VHTTGNCLQPLSVNLSWQAGGPVWVRAAGQGMARVPCCAGRACPRRWSARGVSSGTKIPWRPCRPRRGGRGRSTRRPLTNERLMADNVRL